MSAPFQLPDEKKWDGQSGAKFIDWELLAENALRQQRCKYHGGKEWRASAQLSFIQTLIRSMTTGAEAHRLVMEALQPAIELSAAGKVTSPAALVVPALAEQLGRGRGGAELEGGGKRSAPSSSGWPAGRWRSSLRRRKVKRWLS
jgi:hypothetical protein